MKVVVQWLNESDASSSLARISFPDPIYLSFLQIVLSFLYCPYK